MEHENQIKNAISINNALEKEDFILSISNFLINLVYLHKESCLVNKGKNHIQFESSLYETITLNEYVSRVITYTEAEPMTMIYSLALLKLFTEEAKIFVNRRNIHLLFFLSVLTSLKMNEDSIFSFEDFALIGGVNKQDLRLKELSYLQLIDYRVFVPIKLINYEELLNKKKF